MKSILFIDDDYKRVISHIEMLMMEGYNVKPLTSAQEALEEFRRYKEKYDVIILDLMMPAGEFGKEETKYGRETGLVLLEKLREISKDIPIIVLTVLRDPSVRDRVKKFGANEYLLKPQFPSTLIEVVERFIQKNGTQV